MLVFVIPSTFFPRFAGNRHGYIAMQDRHSYIAMQDRSLGKYYPSVEELPQWIQERYAVLRLLNEHEPSPLGRWSKARRGSENDNILYLFIVRQPGDPEWETA